MAYKNKSPFQEARPKLELNGRNSTVSLRGLTVQIFLLAILPVILSLLAIILVSVNLHNREMRGLVGERNQRSAYSVAGALEAQLTQRELIVKNLAHRASEGRSLEEIMESSDYLANEFDFGLAFVFPDGELVTIERYDSFWREFEATMKNIVMVRENDSPDALYAGPMFYADQNLPVIFVYYSEGPNMPIAIGAFSIPSISFQILKNSFDPGDFTTVFIVDDLQRVVYSVGEMDVSHIEGAHSGVEDALQGNSGTIYTDIDGSDHVIAYTPIEPIGWALVIEEPWETVTSPLLRTTQLAPLLILPVLILAIAGLWFSIKQIVQPLQALREKSMELAWGNYDAVAESVGGIEEIQSLQQELIYLANKVKQGQQNLRGYIGAITQGQEDERHRLARDLHDDIIQSLIALNQRVQLARRTVVENEDIEQLAEIEVLIDSSIQNIRRIIWDLRPQYLDNLGLAPALKSLFDDVANGEFRVAYQQKGNEYRLPDPVELSVYRIVQESINNIIRHAEADEVIVLSDFREGELQISITDDGKGFDVPESLTDFAKEGHYGYLGMLERAELIGAKIEIKSKKNMGSKIIIRVPTQKNGQVIK